jgi:hypothetical protein
MAPKLRFCRAMENTIPQKKPQSLDPRSWPTRLKWSRMFEGCVFEFDLLILER